MLPKSLKQIKPIFHFHHVGMTATRYQEFTSTTTNKQTEKIIYSRLLWTSKNLALYFRWTSLSTKTCKDQKIFNSWHETFPGNAKENRRAGQDFRPIHKPFFYKSALLKYTCDCTAETFSCWGTSLVNACSPGALRGRADRHWCSQPVNISNKNQLTPLQTGRTPLLYFASETRGSERIKRK